MCRAFLDRCKKDSTKPANIHLQISDSLAKSASVKKISTSSSIKYQLNCIFKKYCLAGSLHHMIKFLKLILKVFGHKALDTQQHQTSS
jgi:hypothetical protein